MREQESHMMNVELLINKVRENKAIYDACDKNHSNRNFIAYVWRKIGEELSMPGTVILFHLKMEAIDKVRAKRKVVRSASTKFVNKVKSFLETFDSQNETHEEQLSEYLLNLDAKQIELQTLNKEVEDLLSDEELFEAEIEGSLV
ncbi:uncharacterized protein TNCT_659221 [Trichonephila clavata]|uniref:MADF domain-containing protein n=1 Tax=Trichonephila clavata TaxID=2740835 RepID=A0A8X6LD64_TRICU|nr:uncharacterized protein TNCT_659221 [Trichonephila clavata]